MTRAMREFVEKVAALGTPVPAGAALLDLVKEAGKILARADSVPHAEKYRAYAQARSASEGVLEIDDDAPVSVSDDSGAYVQAWVWVDDEDAGVERPAEDDERSRAE